MEQEPIINEHNLAESESRANPVCSAEPKQGHELNAHNKQEYPPMHTAEHILNQTMVRMFGCPRSRNAHIERQKWILDTLSPEQKYYSRIRSMYLDEGVLESLPTLAIFIDLLQGKCM